MSTAMSTSSASHDFSMALFLLRVISPTLVFLAALSLVPARSPPPSSPSPITSVVVANRVPRRAAILSFLSFTAFTFLLDGLTFVAYAVIDKIWPERTGIEIGAVIGIVAFAGLAALGAWKDINGVDIWSRKRLHLAIFVAFALDLTQVVLYALTIESHKPYTGIPLHLVFPALRVLILAPLLFSVVSPRIVYSSNHIEEEDRAPALTSSSLLLPASSGLSPLTGLGETTKYGTFRNSRPVVHNSNPTSRTPTPVPSSPPDTKVEKSDIALDPSWKEIISRIRRLSPYLWPSKSRSLQLLAVMCVILLIIGRFVNVALPFALGELVRTFEEGSKRSPWPYLFAYVGLRFLQSSGGLNAVRDSLWAPVMQNSDREMSLLSFNHLLNLSFAFHTHRKTGEVLRILDRGAAINHTLELILFNIVPTFVDIAFALVVFVVKFDWSLAVIIFFVMFSYVAASVILTRWRTKIRRQMNDRDVVTRGIHTDCLLNYETVKYFGGEEHEARRYSEAIREYQALEYKVMISLNLLNLVQNLIITTGLLIGSMIVALRVTKGQSLPSDFVIFITYLAQLYGPLNQLGYVYRSVNQSLVDTERLLKLLNEPTEVNDKPGAPDLVVNYGQVEFDNVSFSYDGRTTALNGVSFKVPKGSSVALVGESGAGKSTILRLLYRFYDLGEGEGRILIDGQDIRDVTQASLRKAIGVVPQDSVLFNTSIGYNIGYGKFGASPEDIEAAAKAAQMHERIMGFPNGYETKVGERGVRLSGGEKQRVAIARTLLKNPPILLLDEATSALDTSTEKDIQKALQNLVKGRSSLSIAHRLSTIASADVILVLKDGQIVEQGSHRELLALDGIFASMWADQITTSDDGVVSVGESTKKEVSGYEVEPADPVLTDVQAEVPQGESAPVLDSHPVVDTPQPIDNILPDAEEDGDVDKQEDQAGSVNDDSAEASAEPDVTPSASEPTPVDATSTPAAEEIADEPEEPTPEAPSEPFTFPSSDDTPLQQSPEPSTPQPTGVTFEPNLNSGSRTGTPDPDSEQKRKRTTSQNFQKFARKISLATRKGSTSSFPNLGSLRRDSSPRISADEAAPAVEGSTDSPAGSVLGDKKDKDKKKEKKRKSIM